MRLWMCVASCLGLIIHRFLSHTVHVQLSLMPILHDCSEGLV